VGSCSQQDTLASGGSTKTPFSMVYTLGNTDRFMVQGTFTATNSGGTSWSVSTYPTNVTYLGNSSGTASGADVLTIVCTQDFQDTGTTKSGPFSESVDGGFSGGIASGSTASAVLSVAGTSLGLLGPFSAPNSFSQSNSGQVSGLGNPLPIVVQLTASFGAGSLPHASINFGGGSVGEHLGDCGCKYGGSANYSPSAGDPIDLATGNMVYEATDYKTIGQNPLTFIRAYNSLANSGIVTFAGTLGANWRCNYDRYLRFITGPGVIAERKDGQQLTFTLDLGQWITNTDVDVTLSASGSGVGSTWTLTDGDDTIETYTAISATEALLQSVHLRNGYMQTFSYNASNQLMAVTDSYSRTLSFTYNNGLLSTVTTPDGQVLTYSYGSIGGGSQLTKVAYSTMPVTSQSYVYENSAVPYGLTGVIDENGSRYASWTYDSSGQGLTSQFGSGANLTTITYNTDGSRAVKSALGVTDTYLFATLQGVSKMTKITRSATPTTAFATEAFTYDANGYLATKTDWNGNLTTYVNDIHGQPATINEAVGTPQARTTTIAYDSTWVHLPATVVTPGLTTTFTYDLSGNVLTKTLTDTTTGTTPYSTNGQARTWTNTWTSTGLLASTQGPRADVKELTKFAYDGSGALTSTTNALNQVWQIAQHSPGGLPQTAIDPNGVTTNLTYDARLRLTSSAVTTAAGVLTTKYAYDAAGNLLTTTLPDGSALTNSYDTAHRPTGVTDLFKQSIAYALDALGDRTQTNVAGATGNVQLKHSGTFDALGRILQDIGGVGQTTTFTYDSNANALSVTDPLKNQTQQAFDALNRPVTTSDAAGDVTATGYDAHDRPISVTDPNGGTTTYTYDGFGDLIQQASPVSGITVYHYDPSGNLTQRVDARGVIANFTYDALERVATTVYPGNSAENITYTYDQAGHGFGIGRLTSLTDAAGTLSRSYDERGDILSETRGRGTLTLATSYGYDSAQRIISIGYPSGWTAAYTRDIMGRITAVTAQAPGAASKPTPVVSSVAYQPFGPPNALTYGNAVAETRTFDADYRETVRSDTGKTAIEKLAYAYDLANNVSGITDSVTSGNSQSFGYDTLNRLTSASGAYGKLGYSYDAIGNRVSDSSTLTAPSTPPDGLGSVSSITYTQSGRVAAVTTGSQQTAGYSYDAFGQRLVKTGAFATTYQYDLGGHLLEEGDGQANPLADYIYLGAEPIASVAPSTGHVYFLHDDRLGTPQVATDSNQAVQWTATYQPFGATTNAGALIVQDLRLPGQEFDDSTGWYHNGFREYVPTWGRYSQSDPIGLAGGRNAYLYAESNPTRYIDRDGQDAMPLVPVVACLLNPTCRQGVVLVGTALLCPKPSIHFHDDNAGGSDTTGGESATDTAISDVTKGLGDRTNPGANETNLQGQGGAAGAQEALGQLAGVPGSSVQTTPTGAQVVTLPDGSTATLYPVATSTGGPTIQINRPNQRPIKIRY
jgi:RHS repeat-associated protein